MDLANVRILFSYSLPLLALVRIFFMPCVFPAHGLTWVTVLRISRPCLARSALLSYVLVVVRL